MPNTPNQTLSTPNKRPSIYAKQKACTQSTKYAKKHQVRQAKRKVRQKTPNTAKNTNYAKIFIYADLLRKKTKYAKKNTKYVKQNAEYAKKHQIRQKTATAPKFSFTLICREIFFSSNFTRLLVYLLQA